MAEKVVILTQEVQLEQTTLEASDQDRLTPSQTFTLDVNNVIIAATVRPIPHVSPMERSLSWHFRTVESPSNRTLRSASSPQCTGAKSVGVAIELRKGRNSKSRGLFVPRSQDLQAEPTVVVTVLNLVTKQFHHVLRAYYPDKVH